MQPGGRPVRALPINYAQRLGRRVLNYFDYIARKDSNYHPHIARETAPAGEDMQQYVQTNLRKSLDTKVIRPVEEVATRPWKKKLDGTMFYI